MRFCLNSLVWIQRGCLHSLPGDRSTTFQVVRSRSLLVTQCILSTLIELVLVRGRALVWRFGASQNCIVPLTAYFLLLRRFNQWLGSVDRRCSRVLIILWHDYSHIAAPKAFLISIWLQCTDTTDPDQMILPHARCHFLWGSSSRFSCSLIITLSVLERPTILKFMIGRVDTLLHHAMALWFVYTLKCYHFFILKLGDFLVDNTHAFLLSSYHQVASLTRNHWCRIDEQILVFLLNLGLVSLFFAILAYHNFHEAEGNENLTDVERNLALCRFNRDPGQSWKLDEDVSCKAEPGTNHEGCESEVESQAHP